MPEGRPEDYMEEGRREIDKKLIRPAERTYDRAVRAGERGIAEIASQVAFVGDTLKKQAIEAMNPPHTDRYSQGWEDASLDAEEREGASGDEFLKGSSGRGDPGARDPASGKASEGYQGDALREAARKLMPERGGFWADMISAVSPPDVQMAQEAAYEVTEPQGPDVQPMNQREKDAQAIRAESAEKMADIRADEEHFGYHPDDFPDGPPRPDNIDYDPYLEMDPYGEEPSSWRFMVRDETGEIPEGWNEADEKNWQESQGDPGEMPEGGAYENWQDAVEADPTPFDEYEKDRLEHGPSEAWIYDWIKRDYEKSGASEGVPFERLRWAKEDYEADTNRAIEAWKKTQKQIDRSGK